MAKSALKRLQDGEITQAQYQAEIAKSQAQTALKQSATGTLGDFGGTILEPSQIGSGNYVKDQVVPDVFKASDIGIIQKTNLEKAVEQAEEKAKTITEADGSVYLLDETTGRYKRVEGMSQAESERKGLISQYEQQNSIQNQIASAGQMMSDAQSQAEAARINREKRANDIRTKEGEAGRNLERGFAAFKSAGAQSVEGVQSSARPEIFGAAKDATGKAIDRAVGSDAEMNRLNQIESGSISRINKLQEAVRGLKVGEAYKIEDFQEQLAEELENMKTGMEKQDTDKLYTALTADALSAIAQNPDSINMLLSAYPNAKVSSAQILGMAQLQSIVNEYQSKKVLTPEEQLKFDQAKANLEKTRLDIAQAGQTEADQALKEYQALQGALQRGDISQTFFDSWSQEKGFAPKELTAQEKAEARIKEAEADAIELKNLKIEGKSVSNGSAKVNPIDLTPDFDFGTGNAGQQVKDKEGNVIARISSPFGADHSQISGESIHKGVDLVFNGGNVLALNGGIIYYKGIDKGYGGYVQIQDPVTGDVFQYGHLNVKDVRDLTIGDTLDSGSFLARQETDPSKWGSSTGAHTDYRFAGVNTEGNEDLVVKEYATAILDNRMNISNITGADKEETAQLRRDVVTKMNQMTEEGYKSNYPVLTPTQLELVNQISDDFRSDPQQTDMLDVNAGFQSVKTLYGTPAKQAVATGFDDVAAINAFQRMIDPGATVREGDVELLQTSIPFLEKVSPDYKWSQFTKGDKLPLKVRQSLLRVAKDVYNEKARTFNDNVGTRFKARAEAANVPFNLIGENFTVYGEELGGENEALNANYDSELEAIQQELMEIDKQLNSSSE